MSRLSRICGAVVVVLLANVGSASALTCDDLKTEIARLNQTLIDENRSLANCGNQLGSCTPGQVSGIQQSIVIAQEEIGADQAQLLFVCGPAPSLSGWSIEEIQPDIAFGGRANTIAVNPENNNIILVASETGGLFRSVDRGHSWRHIDGLPDYQMRAVAFHWADPNVVIATTADNFTAVDGGGIWRSTDGGSVWTHVGNPTAPPGVSTRFSGYEISVAQDTGDIFVATAFGVSVSTDRGISWKNSNIYGPRDDPSVVAVLALPGKRILAGGPSGIRRSIDGGATWLVPTSTAGNIRDLHAFGYSPLVADHVFVVNENVQLYYSDNLGDNWTQISSAPPTDNVCGGNAFVKPAGRVFRLGSRIFRFTELFFGNRCRLFTLLAFGSDFSGKWEGPVPADHIDTRDLAFDSKGLPVLLTTDGGLHQTSDSGLHWTLVGGGRGGYNALQIMEVRGQWITDINRYDLYFGTQDNDLWSSSSLGASWNPGAGAEGYFIEALHRVATATDSQITFIAINDCRNNCLSGSLFSNVTAWNNPPGPLGDNQPKIVRKSFHVQNVVDSSSLAHGLAVSYDLGKSWQQYARFPEDWAGDLPKLSDSFHFRVLPLEPPVLYQAIRTGYDWVRGINIYHLLRLVKNRRGGDATITYPLMNNFGGLGVNPTMFPWYSVFGVDPGNAKHIIAPDVIHQKMMETRDGGNNWAEVHTLTSLVINTGRFLFASDGIVPNASVVSFSPDDPNMVAVGTWQGGIFLSGDNGTTWNKVPGSQRITRITSFEWRTPTDAIVSTYGRGLWRFKFQVSNPGPGSGVTAVPCATCSVVFPGRNLASGTFTQGVFVFNGRLQSLRASRGALREVFVSPGSWVRFISDSTEITQIKVTETAKRMQFPHVLSGVPWLSKKGSILVGLVLDKKQRIEGAVEAKEVLSFARDQYKSDKYEEEIIGSEKSPTLGKPYLHLRRNIAIPDEAIALKGTNFKAGSVIEIYMDDYLAEKLTVRNDGTFDSGVSAPRQFGFHHFTVHDKATEKIIDGASFAVGPRESSTGEKSSALQQKTR